MEQQPTTRSAYLLLIFLTFLNILNFVDRQLVVVLAKPLAEELGLSLTQVAWLYGYIFLIFYTLMGMAMAAMADRWSRQRLIAGGLFLWSALTAVSGLAGSFLHLAAARMLVGIGETTLTPAALSILSDAFPPKRRALASGIYYSGVSLGSGLSLIIAGEMVSRYGWRSCFYALGILGLLLAPLVLLMKTPPRGAAEAAAAPATGAQSTLAGEALSTSEIYRMLFQTLRRSPALVLTITAAVLINFSTAASSYSFTWLVKERGMDFRTTGLVMGTIVTAPSSPPCRTWRRSGFAPPPSPF
ncbi:MAG: MFS transporter [Blastocatellia bacterium]